MDSFQQPFCQSCGMPLTAPHLLGTEADGEKSPHYCRYCYQHGSFTHHMTMEEMIDFCVPVEVKLGIFPDEPTARAALSAYLPTLRRWKK